MVTSRIVPTAVLLAIGFTLILSWPADGQKPSGPTRAVPVFPNPSPDPFGSITPAQNGFIVPNEEPKTSRITYEANWRNIEITSRPIELQQGDKPFIWTIRNTGKSPVQIGEGYEFSIGPGEEDFIVDTKVALSAAADDVTTVDIRASRVMTRSELTPTEKKAADKNAIPNSPPAKREL